MLFLHCRDELNGLGPSWMVLTHVNVIFDILEPSAFQKYVGSFKNLSVQLFLHVFCNSTKTAVICLMVFFTQWNWNFIIGVMTLSLVETTGQAAIVISNFIVFVFVFVFFIFWSCLPINVIKCPWWRTMGRQPHRSRQQHKQSSGRIQGMPCVKYINWTDNQTPYWLQCTWPE